MYLDATGRSCRVHLQHDVLPSGDVDPEREAGSRAGSEGLWRRIDRAT